MTGARSLLLPVETLTREFDGKLLLALHAAERGWQTFLGKRPSIHDTLWRYPRSIYFSKDFRAGNGQVFRILSDLGHTIVGLDEEGLVNATDELVKMRIDPAILDHLSRVFAWGDNDARQYRFAGLPEAIPIAVTGNPRGDMLRPELAGYFAPEVGRIRERYGRFALFNTNFALVNHFVASQTRFKVADWVPAEKAREAKERLLGHKAELLDAFLKLLPSLARGLEPHALVIRPHPSEDRGTWAEAARGLANVHVVHEGTVVPWLAAADVLIHNGCTSAVEAALAGTPALAFRPVKRPGIDNDLPNDLSLECETAEALIAAARGILDRQEHGRQALDAGRHAVLAEHIAALEGPLACARLMDELDACDHHLAPPAGPGRRMRGMLRLAGRRVSRRIRKSSPAAKGNPYYLRHKFPDIGLGEVAGRIGRMREALGRFDGVTAEEVVPNVFRVARA